MGRPIDQARRINKSCEVCKQPFVVWKANENRVKTCSKACSKALATQRADDRKGQIPADVIDRRPPSAVTRNLPWVINRCVICDSQYAVARISDSSYSTCSTACASIHRRQNKAGNHYLVACATCGKSVDCPEWKYKAREAFYCSNDCRMIGLNSIPRDPAHTVPCLRCGTHFRTGRLKPRKYCSRECMWEDPEYRQRRSVRHSPTRIEHWLYKTLEDYAIPYERYKNIDRFSVDCYIPGLNLIIEVDGWKWHADRIEYDAMRDRHFVASFYNVVHFTDVYLKSEKRARHIFMDCIEKVSLARTTGDRQATKKYHVLWGDNS